MRNEHVAEPLRSVVNSIPLVDGEPVDYSGLPEFCREPMRLYIEHRCYPGSGINAILCGNLAAVVMCDEQTVRELPRIYRWLHNHAPSACHGSAERVSRWLSGGREC